MPGLAIPSGYGTVPSAEIDTLIGITFEVEYDSTCPSVYPALRFISGLLSGGVLRYQKDERYNVSSTISAPSNCSQLLYDFGFLQWSYPK